MPIVLSEQKYNEVKKLLKSGEYNREQIAQKMFMSHTLVSRVNNTSNYNDYLKEFTTQKTLHSVSFNRSQVEQKSGKSPSTQPKKKQSTKAVKKPVKKSVFERFKGLFS